EVHSTLLTPALSVSVGSCGRALPQLCFVRVIALWSTLPPVKVVLSDGGCQETHGRRRPSPPGLRCAGHHWSVMTITNMNSSDENTHGNNPIIIHCTTEL